MKTYIIWDTRNNEQWKWGAKASWNKAGAAKNALMYHMPSFVLNGEYEDHELTEEFKNAPDSYRGYGKDNWRINAFTDQTRFECWECEVVKVKLV